MKNIISFFLCAVLFMPVFAQQDIAAFIDFKNERVSYMGRIGMNDTCANFYWTGSNVTINVKGTKAVKALLADSRGNNYYYVIVDKNRRYKIKIDKEKKYYTLADGLNSSKHSIQLFKITNSDDAVTRLYGFEMDKRGKLLKPRKKPKRKIEFFGNSITCGHGADVPAGSIDSNEPEYFNNYDAYAATTARYFDAQYHCTAKSGIGIIVSWYNQIMPEIYNRINPNDSNSQWDFENYQPQIVVVNLFQNDSWLVNKPDHPEFKARFGSTKPTKDFIINAYVNFIKTLRSKYPKANIICCLGSMDATKEGSPWSDYIDAAVASLNDKRIVTHFFPYKKTPGHPKTSEQKIMANDLIAFIKKNYWS